jgi:alkanesulfonate monooxygenase SsuD/methylene tetrahydromethanopterin reductase-like flavin-dependent oxidoreductase (luciferase family)
VRLGLALPQYDTSVVGEDPLRWETLRAWAQHAAAVGIDSLWLSDHVVFDLGKYGGPDTPVRSFEPLVGLAALARAVPGPRLGTLVCCEALRPASVLAKAIATLDRLANGRVELGLGAGWYPGDYAAIGTAMPPPGERLRRLREAVMVARAVLADPPGGARVDGYAHRVCGARPSPAPAAAVRVFVGGKGDRLLELAAEVADGWNTCWVWTPDDYAARLAVFTRACERRGRDPATLWRSVGLYALCGEDEADLAARFARLRRLSPPGVLDGHDLGTWRRGRLVGTVAEVRAQAERWRELGVAELILGVGAVPFGVTVPEDLDPLVEALRHR